MLQKSPRPYFQNPAGQLIECPAGQYLVVAYVAEPRRLADLQNLLGYAKQQLARRGWHKMLADQRSMAPFTPEEKDWVTDYWLSMGHRRVQALFGAVLLPTHVFARLTETQARNEGQAAAMTYRFFGDEATALGWLRQVKWPRCLPRKAKRMARMALEMRPPSGRELFHAER